MVIPVPWACLCKGGPRWLCWGGSATTHNCSIPRAAEGSCAPSKGPTETPPHKHPARRSPCWKSDAIPQYSGVSVRIAHIKNHDAFCCLNKIWSYYRCQIAFQFLRRLLGLLEPSMENWGYLRQAKNKLVLSHEIPQSMYIERTARAKLPPWFTAPEMSRCQKHIQLFAL